MPFMSSPVTHTMLAWGMAAWATAALGTMPYCSMRKAASSGLLLA